MTDDARTPPRDALLPAALPTTPLMLDAHGHDPAAYDWIPVRRQRRPDGWSAEKQRAFVAMLADTGSVREAARAVRMSPKSAYELRRAPDAAAFAAAWDSAIAHAAHVLLDAVTDRAINGVQEFVYDRTGAVVGSHTRYDNRLAMFLLRAHLPHRFRHAHRTERHAAEPAPPAAVPVATALARLDPVAPVDPAAALSAEELATRLTVADLNPPGQLPHYHRDRDLDPEPAYNPRSPLGEEFERLLAEAKGERYRPPGEADGPGRWSGEDDD